jgi:hypothetical protein
MENFLGLKAAFKNEFEDQDALVHVLRFSGLYSKGKDLIKSLPKTYEQDGYIYFIQLSPTRVKIGKTSNPFKRVTSHVSAAREYSGDSISSVSIYGPFSNVEDRESEMKQFFLSLGAEIYTGAEWFKFKESRHIFDITPKFQQKDFLHFLTQESFDFTIKQNIRDFIQDGSIRVQSLFYSWAESFSLTIDDYSISIFMSLLQNFCEELKFCSFYDNNKFIKILNSAALDWYCSS